MVEQNDRLEKQADRLCRKLSKTRDNDKDVVKAGLKVRTIIMRSKSAKLIMRGSNDLCIKLILNIYIQFMHMHAGTKDYESSCKETEP